MRTVAMRRLRTFTLVLFAVVAMALYGQIVIAEQFGHRFGMQDPVAESWRALRDSMTGFYTLGMFLQALIAVLVGSSLVADDLRTRALPLYLVRPMRPIDYAIGKALVIPAILTWVAFLPGLLFLLLVSLWQPPGGTWSFFGEHVEVLEASAHHFAVAAAAYAGLMLLVSSRTTRRGAAIGTAAVVVFGGTMLQGLSWRMPEGLRDVARVLGIPLDSLVPILETLGTADRHIRRVAPDRAAAVAFALLLLALGLFATWRRARSVEVTS
jgi:hypothetical protein